MPELYNDEKNIFVGIELLINEYLDIEESRNNYENWIPFSFILETENNRYSYPPEKGATFSLYELKNFIFYIENLIRAKRNGYKIDTYDFHSSEAYFSMSVYDPFEENELGIDLWINMGTLTDGVVHGYEKGVRFIVALELMAMFIKELEEQLRRYNSLKNETDNLFKEFYSYEINRLNEIEMREENLKAATIIKNMLRDKLSFDLIEKYTGLTKEQLCRIDL